MTVAAEQRFDNLDLASRVGEHRNRMYLVQNSLRGIILDDRTGQESWSHLGYVGDGRRNHWAIEVRARNGRVVAAVGWWVNPDRKDGISTLGTYVAKKLRRRGIATSLWISMLQVTGAPKVYSEPVTDTGLTLVQAMREKGVLVEIIENPDTNTLEDLRVAP